MAVVHHIKARKDYPDQGIKKGDMYYFWEFPRGGKFRSMERPKRSRTTQSAFYQQLWDIEDDVIAKLPADESLKDAVQDVAQQLRDLASECQENLDNMPEGLQQGDTGQMLEERVSVLEEAADEFENIDFEDKDDDTTDEEYWEQKLQEAQEISIDAP
jgi:hypothetical protein